MAKRTVSTPAPRRQLPLRRSSSRFTGHPESVKEARDWLDRILALENVPEQTVGTALLLLSELASNNVKHAPARTGRPGDFYVRAFFFPDRVRVEVRDAHGRRPTPRTVDPGAMAESGNGLLLVNAFASHWGRFQSVCGPGMFFELEWDDPARDANVLPLPRNGR